MLAAATRSPERLVIGVDSDARAMAEASRRAALPERKGGLPNARFVVAAAEALPAALDARVDLVTIHFPWGSLLRGLISGDDGILSNLARIARPGAEVRAMLSVTERDLAGAGRSFDPLAVARSTPAGLQLCEVRPATPEEIQASSSTWAKRLRAGDARPVWLLQWERRPERRPEPRPERPSVDTMRPGGQRMEAT